MVLVLVVALRTEIQLLLRHRWSVLGHQLKILHLQRIILLLLGGMHLLVWNWVLLVRRHHVILGTSHRLVVLIRRRMHAVRGHHLVHVRVHLLRPHYWLRHFKSGLHLPMLWKLRELLIHGRGAALLAFKWSFASIITVHWFQSYRILSWWGLFTFIVCERLVVFLEQRSPLLLDFHISDIGNVSFYLLCQLASIFKGSVLECILNDKISIWVHN